MTLLKAGAAIVLLLLSPAASASANDGNNLTKLTVTAWIDGRDLLYISPTDVHWHHLDSSPPGKWKANYPTDLAMANGAPELALVIHWFPRWECPPENPNCYGLEADSSVLPLAIPLPPQYQLIDLEVIQGRHSLTVYQYPGVSNDYTSVIDFDDDPRGGADWYAVQLTFAPLD